MSHANEALGVGGASSPKPVLKEVMGSEALLPDTGLRCDGVV